MQFQVCSLEKRKRSRKKKMKFNTADRWFSKYVRIRDIISGEHCRCKTCGKPIHWKYEAECGHFVTRNHPMTRYNEQNCHAQCSACNNHNKGEQFKHGAEIDKMYGEGTAQSLIDLGSIRGQKIHGKLALKDIAKEYRKKARQIAKEKGVEL